jgi:hypothetical protein
VPPDEHGQREDRRKRGENPSAGGRLHVVHIDNRDGRPEGKSLAPV